MEKEYKTYFGMNSILSYTIRGDELYIKLINGEEIKITRSEKQNFYYIQEKLNDMLRNDINKHVAKYNHMDGTLTFL